MTEALEQAEQPGLFVTWVPMAHPQRGAYHHPTRTVTVYLPQSMPDEIALPALLREIIHARRGDDGRQTSAVEARINREVTHMLIARDEYAAAETVAGGRGSGAMVAEVGRPGRVAAAYRQTLRRTVVRLVG